jgi:hypothetical protein
MIRAFCTAGLIALTLSAAAVAAPIRFDFGDGTVDGGTGVAANVVIAEDTSLAGTQGGTVDGVAITLQGIGPSDRLWGANSQGIGIITAGVSQSQRAGQRRIDGTVPEFIYFSFDTDVTIDSVRLGNFTPNPTTGSHEEAEIAFVSGVDPFGGGSFTVNTATVTAGPTDDIPVGVFVTAGTVLSLAASIPQQNGVLWNDIVVTPIPEPATAAMLTLAAVVGIVVRRRSDPCCI